MKKSIIVLLTVISLLMVNCNSDTVNINKCKLVPDRGTCDAIIIKYYYDQNEKKCKEFNWGGCGGTVPFDTMELCNECGGD